MSSALRITIASVAAAVAFLPASASAADSKNQGYLTDTKGDIVHYSYGCVRSSDWTPARAVAECDPDLVKKPAPKAKAAPKKAAPKAKAKPKAKPKAKKPSMLNIAQKIELQGMPFDKAEMTADNKKELDKFFAGLAKATKARGPVTLGAIVVTGHTDRIGTLKYNMALSERRAVVVKDYIIAKGIDQKLIFWEGKGEKQPIPVTKFCDNKMKRKQLIECLAPNRRVTVEAVGRALNLAKPKPKAKPGAKKPKAKR
jgi:OOP family OmpA-OmpF porin